MAEDDVYHAHDARKNRPPVLASAPFSSFRHEPFYSLKRKLQDRGFHAAELGAAGAATAACSKGLLRQVGGLALWVMVQHRDSGQVRQVRHAFAALIVSRCKRALIILDCCVWPP